MSEVTTIIVGLLSGAAGAIGVVWLLRTFLGSGIKHFFAVALQARETVGTRSAWSSASFSFRSSTAQFTPTPNSMNNYTTSGWRETYRDINLEIIAQFRKQNERVVEILATKLHLVEDGQPPPAFTHFMTSVTLWNLYTARPDQPWLPEHVAALPQAKYPKEFDEYIYATTEKLKKTLDDLHKKYGIT